MSYAGARRQPTASQRRTEAVRRWIKRAWNRVERAVRVARPLAWVLISGTALLGVLGVLLGWGELTIAAIIGAVVLVVSLLFLIGRTAYVISLDMPRRRVVVGDRAYGSLTLQNPGARAIPASRVILPVGEGCGAFDIGRMAPGAEDEELFSIPTHRRGVLQVGPVSVLRGDPLGLFERVDSRQEQVQLFVHPKTAKLAGLSLGRVRDLEGLPTTDLSSDDVSFHALREYAPGDDLRHAHWRSTARTGRVMVRQYEETRRSNFLVGLSTHPNDYTDPESFELAVSIAGSIGVRALTDSPDLTAMVPGRTLRTSSPTLLLDDLSSVALNRTRGGDVVGLGNQMSLVAELAALVVIICGAEASPASVREACARLPQGARVLVVSSEPGAAAILRKAGDADVLTVGSLDDLPAALRRVLS